MFNYQGSANTALKLLTKFGRDITHVKTTTGVYNVATSSVTNTTVSTIVKACDFATKGNQYKSELIQGCERYALVQPSIDLNVQDALIIDGVTWTIKAIEKLAPAGITVLYKAYISK